MLLMPPDLARFPINPRHRVKMERMNGEVRNREKVMKGLKRSDTPILESRYSTITSDRTKV